MTDKRRARRKIKRLFITFSDGVSEHKGISSDFSDTGLFIRTRINAFDPGTPVNVVLEVDEDRGIKLTGEVVRAIRTGILDFKNGMGIRLTDIPQSYKDFLEELKYEE